MSLDAELEVWRREWQSETSVPADLRRKVERHTRFMRLMLAAELLVSAVMGGGTTALAIRSPRVDMVVLAVAVWTFIAAAWTFALRSRRGLWAPAALNHAAFVDLSIRRCRASLAATVFGFWLYGCEMVFCLAWIYHRSGLSSGLLLFVGVFTIAFAGFMLRYRRRKRMELEYLARLADHGIN